MNTKFKVDNVVCIAGDDLWYIVVEVYPNFGGMGKHKYLCRVFGGDETQVVREEVMSLSNWFTPEK